MNKLSAILKCALFTLLLTLPLQVQAYSGKTATPQIVSYGTYESLGLTDEELSDNYGSYAITTPEELYGFSYLVNNNGNINAILINDIVVNDTIFVTKDSLYQGKLYQWYPIGSEKHPFCGKFDGRGHIISGLYYQGDDLSAVGLFGYVKDTNTETRCSINNVHLSNSYFNSTKTATCYVGGFAGAAYNCQITNCSVDKTAIQTKENASGDVYAGGFIGHYDSKLAVSGCMTFADIHNSQTAPFTPFVLAASFSNCFFAGDEALIASQPAIGGISRATAEQLASGQICYRLNNGISDGTQCWFQNLSNAQQPDTIPVPNHTHGTVYQDTPCAVGYSNNPYNTRQHIYDPETGLCSLCGEIGDPISANGYYQLWNIDHLYWFANYVNNGHPSTNAMLMRDIVDNENLVERRLNGTVSGAKKFTAIGKDKQHPYYGTFDGQGHSISGIYVNPTVSSTDTAYIGLFGYVFSAKIRNLQVLDSYMSGYRFRSYIGALAGYVYNSTISQIQTDAYLENSYNTTTWNYFGTGGMIGYAWRATMTDCAAQGTIVSSRTCTGGLIAVAYTMSSSQKNVLTRCLSSVHVNCSTSEGYYYCGAMVGLASGYSPTYNDCFYIYGRTNDGSGTQMNAEGTNTPGNVASDPIGVQEISLSTAGNGYLCMHFNELTHSEENHCWYQNIDNDQPKDEVPVVNSKHGRVYTTQPCPSYVYSNSIVERQHVIGSDGKCTRCHGYEEPEMDADGYYVFTSPYHFFWLNDKLKASSRVNVRLGNNLDFTGIEYTPMGTSTYPYAGTFDGQGHTISGLNVTDENSSNSYIGLFGQTNGTSSQRTKIKGIHLDATCTINATKGSTYSGALIAKASYTEIEDCLNEAYSYTTMTGTQPYMVESTSYTFFYRCITRYRAEDRMVIYNSPYGSSSTSFTTPDEATLISGQICHELNNGVTDGSQYWYQTIGEDAYPVLDRTHGTVYTSTPCADGGYYNHAKENEHQLDSDGFCTYCGKCPEPEQDEEGYYLLSSVADLFWMNANASNKYDIKFRLVNDITVEGNARPWTPINYFYGELDGQNHTISGIRITSTNSSYAGFVANLSNGSNIHNLCLMDITVTNNYDYGSEGLLAGYANNATITDCLISGTVNTSCTYQSSSCFTGGFIGYSSGYNTISSCMVRCQLNSNRSSVSPSIGRPSSYDRINHLFYQDTNNQSATASCGTLMTNPAMLSGEVCCLLNDSISDGTQSWYQTLGEDHIPLLDATHGTVYAGTPCYSGYTNSEELAHRPHDYGSNSVCKYCGHTKAPEKDDEGTYLISNANELLWIGRYTTIEGAAEGETVSIRLTADIDFDNGNIPFCPITLYDGTFDGDGHTVSGIRYDEDPGIPVGFFSIVKNAYVLDLMLMDCSFQNQSNTPDGGLVGVAGQSYIYNCLVDATVTNTHVFTSDDNCTYSYDLGCYLGTGSFVGTTTGYNRFVNCMTFGTATAPTERLYTNLLVGYKYYDFYYCVLHLNTLGTDSDSKPISIEELAAGKACYLFNKNTEDNRSYFGERLKFWYQNIDNGETPDAMPVLDPTHGEVYVSSPCASKYSNTPGLIVEHDFDADGICACGLITEQPDIADGWYLIDNAEKLTWFAYQVNGGNTSIRGRLTSSIYVDDIMPSIGTAEHPFSGSFDGGGYGLTRLKNNQDTEPGTYSGLFGYVQGSPLQHVHISNITLSNAHYSGYVTGGIAAYAQYADINCCYIEEGTMIAGSYVGGIVAEGSHVTISDCKVEGVHFDTPQCIGGLLAHDVDQSCVLSYCYSTSNYAMSDNPANAYLSPDAASQTECYWFSNIRYNTLHNNYGFEWGDPHVEMASMGMVYSGQLCYILNRRQSSDDDVWGQLIQPYSYEPLLHGVKLYVYDDCIFTNESHNSIVLSDETDYNITQEIMANEIVYSRKNKSNAIWGTLCVPFCLNADQEQSYAVQAYVIDRYEGSTLYFVPFEGETVPAWTPIVYRCAGETNLDFVAPLELIDGSYHARIMPQPASLSTVQGDWTWQATTSTIDCNPDDHSGKDIYYLSGDKLWHAVKSFRIRPFRAWFETVRSNGAPAHLNLEVGTTEETDLHIVIEEDGLQTDITYDLLGRPQTEHVKGLKIKDSRKIFVK